VREGGEVRTLSRERIDRMLDQYYELRGWNVRTGIPGKEKLAELQLDDLADDLPDSGHVR
jgi:aldehyde:ferredoxin oxidoreductase